MTPEEKKTNNEIMCAIINAKTEAMMRAIKEFEVARSGWIHHCNAPAILAALWDCSHPEALCNHTLGDNMEAFTAPGIGAAGYQYCIKCGKAKD